MVLFKRFIFVLAILVGLMFLSGEGGGFMRIFVAFACFLFAWGAWENWEAVRELEQKEEHEQEDEDDDKWQKKFLR
jgi:threonine/homoserine/homoserine lactone efflux protein